MSGQETSGSETSKTPVEPKKEEVKPVSFLSLFQYANTLEYFWLFIGVLMSALKALMLPAVVIIYSEFTSMLVDRAFRIGTTSTTYFLPILGGGKILVNATVEENNVELYNDSISYGILLTIASLILFLSGVVSIDIFNLVALQIVTRIRIKAFYACMRKDIGWHDMLSDTNFAQTITDDVEKIRDGISEKVAHFLNLIIGFVIMVCISLAYGWKLTLAVSVYVPIVMIMNHYFGIYQSRLTTREQESYATAGNLAEEVLSSIRTVIAFGGEKAECQKFDKHLIPARIASKHKACFSAISDGILRSMLFLSCAGSFWYGVNLILADRFEENKEYTPAILMIAFFGIIVGADNISRTAPFLQAFAMARGCARNIFKAIDEPSKIDPFSVDGKILNYGLRGVIEFRDVFFRYPSRPETIIHRGLNFKVNEGETLALVGSSGCGKSTCVQLLQRFYDPVFGEILLDDLDLRRYNISWLRSNIAIVGQEPVLFQGTIAENIRHGKPAATQREVEECAKAAGVHEFVANLPESYQTFIGERGVQLSGGQKQRIAIARALISNPKILLLDEATSALDYTSEKLVQEALDIASKGRTTIVVSHRLSAIRAADRIVYLDKGKVIESGSHDELMQLQGNYYKMVTSGNLKVPDEQTNEEQELEEKFLKRKSLEIYEKSFELDTNNLDTKAFELPCMDKILNKDPEKKEETEEDKTEFFKTFGRIFMLARPEWVYLLVGTISAILFGFTYPGFALIFGEFYAALSETDEQIVLNRTANLSIACLVIGVITGFICFAQTYFFNLAGGWLTTRIRSSSFKSIISQDVSWFDDEKNSVGALSARLSGDAANVEGAIGYPLSGIIQAISNFIISTSFAFFFSWKLSLLCLSTCPIIIGTVVIEASLMSKQMLKEKEVLEKCSQIATEAITNIRTVAGLRREEYMIKKYNVEIRNVEKHIRQKLRWRGLINSSGQAFVFFAYAVALCYGGVMVSREEIPFQDIIKVSETLLYGSMMLAQSLAFAPAFTAALVAGHRIFKTMDRKSIIQSPTSHKSKVLEKVDHFEGVRFKDIEFRYPTRPDIQILRGLNLDILKGKTVGLVGHSGCGKSTCIQLLLRYYDPDSGKVFINEESIKNDLSLEALRSRLGLVSQEPVLFERTIAENIAYGDNSRECSLSEIMEAAKKANAHNFIINLPNGYDTKLGSRGTQLSGGEKQRVAIARALVRNPQILLLDEATSALDLHSEKIVQEALDEACTGRTCIVIAHRLSTIQNADVICVVKNGVIAETGSHHQLIAKNGLYATLYKTQPKAE